MTSPGGGDPTRRDVLESEGRAAARPRVLLADDYTNILTAMVRLISSSCDVVGTVTTGAQLLDAAKRFAPDVVVVDLNLPDMSGLDACRQLKAASPHASVILLTAASDPRVREGAFESGASAFIPKYRAGDELLPAIEKAFAGLARGEAS
jgi:DNA-binding NarL/FixJ family response regulator